MKDKIFLFVCILLTVCVLTSCNNQNGSERVPVVRDELTISGLEDGKWVYFSIESGSVVGSSAFLSEEEDAIWAKRSDWDFAICGDYLKTNGGASGSGRGGILRDETHNFQTLKEAPSEGYLIDKMGIVK